MTKYAIFEKVEISVDIPQSMFIQNSNLHGSSKEVNIVTSTEFTISSDSQEIIDKYMNRFHLETSIGQVWRNESDLKEFFQESEMNEIEITECFDDELLTIKIVRL